MIKTSRKIWFPIVMWAFLFGFLFSMINFYHPTKHALIKASFEVFNFCVMYYFTSLYLFPKFHANNKKYLQISILAILIFALLFFLVEIHLIPGFPREDIERPPMFFIFFRNFMSLGFTFFVATSVSLMDHNNQLQKREKLLTEEKLATELKLLKAQINPHFIFNALNNIYSLSYMESKNAPESILKLSAMLRYVFYDCSKDRVPLSAELKYIENFVAFQQMKSDFVQNIKIETSINGTNTEIAPMLFVPFIENAFKYSRIEEKEEAVVNITIKQQNKRLHFFIENFVPANKPNDGSGMGIKNVKHRLDIIYPGKYDLKIKEENERFMVDLTLEL